MAPDISHAFTSFRVNMPCTGINLIIEASQCQSWTISPPVSRFTKDEGTVMAGMERAMVPMHGREAHYDRISASDIAPFWEQLDWPAASRLAIHHRQKGGL